MDMTRNNSVRIKSATAVAVPVAHALPALATVLREFKQRPGAASLALDMRQLHVPLEALITVPVRLDVTDGAFRNEWQIHVCAESKPQLYPVLEGLLKLVDAIDRGSQLELDGVYVVPFGALGHAVDITLFRGAAESSLHRFIRDLANRVASLSHWAALA
jgi:hypothetical protein